MHRQIIGWTINTWTLTALSTNFTKHVCHQNWFLSRFKGNATGQTLQKDTTFQIIIGKIFYTLCQTRTRTHTRLTALFPGLPGWASTRKLKPIWISLKQESEWKWHQLGHMQVCTSLQTDNHASTPPLSFFTGRMPFLPPNQQRQSKKIGTGKVSKDNKIVILKTWEESAKNIFFKFRAKSSTAMEIMYKLQFHVLILACVKNFA